MNKKSIIIISIVFGLLVTIGVVIFFSINKKTTISSRAPINPTPNYISTSTATVTTTTVPSEISTSSQELKSECEKLTGYTIMDYQDGWREKFQKENKLSNTDFNNYITIHSTTLLPLGKTCELVIRYAIKKDWILVERLDNMILGVPPVISPQNLPLESDPQVLGRTGVSTIKLQDKLSFSDQASALNYFVNKYSLSGTDIQVKKEDFQYFWNKESSDNSNQPFAGEGGEPYLAVSGVINAAQNKCYSGELSLVSQEATYLNTPCIIN